MDKGLLDVLKRLEDALDKGGSEKEVATLVLGLVDEKVKDHRPLIKALPAVAAGVSKEAAPVFAAFMAALASIASSPELAAAQAKFARARAKLRRQALDAYMKAGFRRAEAIQLMIAEANAFSAASTLSDVVKAGKGFAVVEGGTA